MNFRSFPAILLLRLCVLSFAGHLLADDLPAINKAQLADYIRYSEAFTAEVTLVVEDPVPSPFNGFSRVVAHVTAGKQNLGDKIYYVSADGRQFVNGNIWNSGASPFEDNLTLLPKSLPATGAAQPAVTIVIFSDFQCPFCRQLAQSVRESIPKEFPAEVRVSFADFPLESKHPWARVAAEASHCVSQSNADAFWQFHDWIFAHQSEVTSSGSNFREKLAQLVGEKHWNAADINTCLDTHAMKAAVDANIGTAYLLGVQQTPTMFVNGRKVEGALPWSNLQSLIKFELHRPQEIPVTPAH